MEENDFTEQSGNSNSDRIFEKSVKAKKKTYFFDVKVNKYDQQYIVITESNKTIGENGKVDYKRSRIFLYKNDIDCFMDGLNEVFHFMNGIQENEDSNNETISDAPIKNISDSFTDLNFEDLGG